MFLYADPQAQLDLYHQRAAERTRQAAAYRLARDASLGRPRFRWWRRRTRVDRPAPVSAPA
jgi:hypothetical protein